MAETNDLMTEILTILTTALAKSEVLEDEIITRVKSKNLKDILVHRNLGVRLQIQQAIKEVTKA
jgi:hypothetical protein